ncbi:glycosyltransferase [Pedobacter mendelii]|uniref:Glycosyl transferase n=1 Tax=Pedobacter mendelii TaxID=1908240 RepID=A0ABQ2BIA0_9SPHI|nr:glycosyltransferase [Pedobacter mendelii]GGI26909.1 glycosyl transferase [Pedobacter mendelii]
MRILIIHTFYKLQGGEDIVVENEMKLLHENGHEVELLKFDNSNSSFIKLILMPFNLFAYFKTKKFIRHFKPDIIHIHNLHFGASLSVLYAAKNLKIPIVMTLHNYRFLCPSGSLYFNGKLFIDSLQPGFPWLAVKKGVYKNSRVLTFWLALSNYFHQKINTLNIVDKFILLGNHSLHLFSESHFKAFKDKLVVKPNFTYLKTLEKKITGKYFIFIGRLTEEKGINTLLKAFLDQSINLKIIGSGPLENAVLDTCQKSINIEFLGQKSSTDVSKLLENAEALIFPSEWFETFGMVLSESFSKGVPVIASELGDIKNIVLNNQNGLTFEPGNFLDLREKINYFDNLSLAKKNSLKKLALETYNDKFSPKANYQELHSIYKKVISTHFYRQ